MGDYKKFLRRVGGLLGVLILIVIAGFFSHVDRVTHIYTIKYKHKLLQTVAGPRIIFVGGSNVRLGINSQLFKDSLKMNPINTALSAGLGLKLIVEDLKPYLKANDIVILAPEYMQFYGDNVYGNDFLAQTINICPEDIKTLNLQQLKVLLATLPRNNIGKLVATCKVLMGRKVYISAYESAKGMNQYGDTYAHWNMRSIPHPLIPLVGNFNPESIKVILDFNKFITGKLKGKLFITYPPFPQKEYDSNRSKVDFVQKEFESSGIPVLGQARDFVYNDSLFFNSEYHLTKAGGILRSNTLIKDIKPLLARAPAKVQ